MNDDVALDTLEFELRRLPGVLSVAFDVREDVLTVQLHVRRRDSDPELAAAAARLALTHTDLAVAVEMNHWRTSVPAEPRTPGAGSLGTGDAPTSEPVAEATDEPIDEAVAAPESVEPATGGLIDLAAAEAAEHDAVPAPTQGLVVAGGDDGTTAAGGREPRVRLLAVLTFPDTDDLEVHLSYDGRRSIGRASASRGVVGASEATIDGLRSFAPEIGFAPTWARPLESGSAQQFLVATELFDAEQHSLHGLATGSSPIEAAARSTLHALNRTIAPQLTETH